MIQTKYQLFEALCDPQLNFLESFERILTEVSKLNKENKEHKENSNNNIITQNYIEDQDKIIYNDNQSSDRNFSHINKYEKIEINIINIIINMLFNIPNVVKTYILSKSQKNREYPLLNELCNIIISKRNFGTKYEVSY